MLTIGKLGGLDGASRSPTYYTSVVATGREDYYAGSGEAPGEWVGQGAAMLGLSGEVEADDLGALMEGRRPGSGEQLRRHFGERAVVGFDLTFSAPKSVSVLYGAGDEQVSQAVRLAHDGAVRAALGYMEREACRARRGHGGLERVRGEGFAAAAFRHRQELDGSVSEAVAWNAGGLAQPEPRSIHGDRPDTLETFEQRKERERGRAAAVEQHDRRSLARLDDMYSSTGAKLLSTASRGGAQHALVDGMHLIGVRGLALLICPRANCHRGRNPLTRGRTLKDLHAAVTPLHPDAPRFEGGQTEVAPGIHAWLQPNGLLGESNAGLVIGDGASLLVDTLWDPHLTRRMLAAIAPLTAKASVETLVNTHSDGDHWWGNQELDGIQIVAAEAAAAVMGTQSPGEMKRFGALTRALQIAGSLPLPYPRRGDVAVIGAYAAEALRPFAFDDVRLVPPTRTFSGELELDVGGREVRLIEVGPAHTPGDLIVWVPDAKVAIAADILFIGVTPIMWAGPVERWIAALELLLELGAERFVPGHGPVCGEDEVQRLIEYWRWLDRTTIRNLEAGRSVAETARELVLGDEIAELGFAEWLGPERALVSIRTIDAHRRGVARLPGPREVVGAFFRMAMLASDLQARQGRGRAS